MRGCGVGDSFEVWKKGDLVMARFPFLKILGISD
jgi:hypothetical protein